MREEKIKISRRKIKAKVSGAKGKLRVGDIIKIIT